MKKIFALAAMLFLLSAMLVVSVSAVDFTVSPAATEEILGDANGDGKVSSADVIQMKRLFAGTLDSIEIGADANGDGKASLDDILNLKRSFAGIEEIGAGNTNSVKIVAVEGVDVRNMSIVAPEGTNKDSDNEAYAADMLRKHLKLATGYEYVVEYGEASKEHGIYIICDPTWDGESWEGGELGTEDFIIEIRDGNVYITGGFLRGCMYGVFEFLEEYIGWRFLPDNDYIYPADIINLKNGVYDHQTANLDFRSVGIGSDAGMKLKLNSKGGNYITDKKVGYVRNNLFSNAHSYAYYRDDMWPILQGKDEAYDERLNDLNLSWQPCFSEQYDEMFRGMIRTTDWVVGWGKLPIPGQTCVSFSINDNSNYCMCPDCKEIYERIGISGACIEFASRAADDLQDYYPGMQIYTITYDKAPYIEGIYVSDYLVIMYCGIGCNNHIPGAEDCGDGTTALGTSNVVDVASFPSWCKASSNVRFWSYAITYMRNLAPCPNVLNIYGDMKFVIDSGAVGINHEAGDGSYFEGLKAYIAARVMWDTDMTEDECRNLILEYLYFTYGEGYNEIYRLIELMDAAGDGAGCFINNHDYPMEMYSLEVLDTQYEEILSLVEAARSKTTDSTQLDRFDRMALHLYFLALCGGYDRVYANGTDEAAKAEYRETYEYLYYYLKDNNIPIFSGGAWLLPEECNLDKNPMFQFYGTGYSGQR